MSPAAATAIDALGAVADEHITARGLEHADVVRVESFYDPRRGGTLTLSVVLKPERS